MKTLEKSNLRKPDWIKKNLFYNSKENGIKEILKEKEVHTVCQEARCPNIGECFSNKTATFLLLGNVCTRNCKFCNISSNKNNLVLDKTEYLRIANTVKKMNLKYVVLTSVTRDDLNDGGASVFVDTINAIKSIDSNIKIEVLTPDFDGNINALNKVLNSPISVFNHNLETVKNIYTTVRPEADYERSLNLLRFVKSTRPTLTVKSGIMVGLGETAEEVYSLMEDVKDAGVDILTIGQYLSPGRGFYPVQGYIKPEQYNRYKSYGTHIGIKQIIAGTFVRSSYFAEKSFINANLV